MTAASDRLVYAGFWIRVWASVIDSVLVMALLYPLLSVIYGSSYWTDRMRILDLLGMALRGQLGVGDLRGLTAATQSGAIDTFLSYGLPAVAVVLFWMYRSATPGKMAIRATIVDADSGGAPSTRQLVLRYLGYFLSLIPIGAGFLWVGLDGRKQGWHDKLANTVVVRRRRTF